MGTTSLFDRFRKLARELRTANGANVTVTFALATLPMVGFVGAAVDYSRANSVKAAMQAASDSTALMVSKIASGLTQSEVQTKANDYFKALFLRPEATGLQISRRSWGGPNGTVDGAARQPFAVDHHAAG